MYRSLVHPENQPDERLGKSRTLDEFIARNKLSELLYPFSGLVMQMAETNELEQVRENRLLLDELLEELVKQAETEHLEELGISLGQYRSLLHRAISEFCIPMPRESVQLMKCEPAPGKSNRVA
jgi:hypothetical protein